MNTRAVGFLFLIIIMAASGPIAGCEGPAPPPNAAGPLPRFVFTDATEDSGIDMIWTSGVRPTSQIIEAKGGGVALLDYDDDGDLDIFVPNGATMDDPEGGPGCRLFANDGALRFVDVTRSAGLTLQRWALGVAAGDFDGDGHVDLYVTCYGANALLRNTGEGAFEDVTAHARVGGASWSAAASFGDLDGDGDLDLYVANYLEFDIDDPPAPSSFKGAPVFRGPLGLVPQADTLYENLGNGTFRDVSVSSGCRAVESAFGLGVVILDFDGDGRQDIYVGNDSTPNFLFTNGGEWRFDETARLSGLAVNVDGAEQSTMGIAIADVSGNGFPDIFTTNFSNDTNTLAINKQGRFYDDETRRYGVGMSSFPYVGWAAAFHDFDLDGDEDLLAFNGHVYPNATTDVMDAEYDEPALLYERTETHFRRFVEPTLETPHCDRGAAFGDLDGDGDVDVVVVELGGPIRVIRNDQQSRRHWLVVAPDQPLGCRVELRFGDTVQTRWIFSGGSFASASAPAAYFGIGVSAAELDVTVTWPDGRTTNDRVDSNRLVRMSPD